MAKRGKYPFLPQLKMMKIEAIGNRFPGVNSTTTTTTTSVYKLYGEAIGKSKKKEKK